MLQVLMMTLLKRLTFDMILTDIWTKIRELIVMLWLPATEQEKYFHDFQHYFQMNYFLCCLAFTVLIGPNTADKVLSAESKSDTDSYENGVGTSYTVALNPKTSAKVSKNSRKYSVSADDLERADLHASSSSHAAPVYSGAVNTYSKPVNNLDSYVAPAQDVAQARDGAGGHHHHGHHAHHGQHAAVAEEAVAPAASVQSDASYQVNPNLTDWVQPGLCWGLY